MTGNEACCSFSLLGTKNMKKKNSLPPKCRKPLTSFVFFQPAITVVSQWVICTVLCLCPGVEAHDLQVCDGLIIWRYGCVTLAVSGHGGKKKIHSFGTALRMCLRNTQGGSSKHDWSPTDILAGRWHRPIVAYRRISLLVSSISWYGTFLFYRKKNPMNHLLFLILLQWNVLVTIVR